MTISEDILTQLKKGLEKGNIEKEEKEFKDVEVEKSGSKIIIPDGMSYSKARHWLREMEEAEETKTRIRHRISCYPLDGALALSKAIKRIYGFTQLKGQQTFFGEQPPMLITIPTGPKPEEFETVMWGRLHPPGVEGYLQTSMDTDGLPTFVLTGVVKRKHEEAIKAIITMTEEIVKNESIYKGQPVRVQLDYLQDNEEEFDPEADAPVFMDVSGVKQEDLILDEATEFTIKSAIWGRIQRSEHMLENGVPLKHGVLLKGTYGTGKTLAARVTASIAKDNGWTFIYLENAMQLADAIRFADLYAPAVLFAEDVDKAVEGDQRTENINQILNTLDGVDTKGKPIITVLTTNHPENINPAFMRAGRIDTVISLQRPDSKVAARFVKVFGGEYLSEDVNFKEVGKAMEGFTPSFIEQAVNRAKTFALTEGRDLKGSITNEDLIHAATSLESHIEMANTKKQPSKAETFFNNTKHNQKLLDN